jgi:nitroimidazol reductase NimA-like FMN-containing flavoprotein (pyridoxamine 5'-phosphate oxidase superfamily)
MNSEQQDRARRLVEDCKHMIIASADEAGGPRVSPVFYAYDEDHALYWVSSQGAQHSANIRVRPGIDLVIFSLDGGVDALYIEAEAHELSDEAELAAGTKVMQSRGQAGKFMINSPADVSGDAAWRIYKAVPRRRYLREEATENGQTVTRRQQIDAG